MQAKDIDIFHVYQPKAFVTKVTPECSFTTLTSDRFLLKISDSNRHVLS